MNPPQNNMGVWAQKNDGTWWYCYYNTQTNIWMIGVDLNPIDAPLDFQPIQWLTEEEYDKLIGN